MIRTRFVPFVAVLALAVAGCGDDEDSATSASDEPTAADTAPAETTPVETTAPSAEGEVTVPVSNAKDLDSKPKVARPAGSPPATLVTHDLVVGSGPAAKSGDLVSVQYVGVAFSSGKEFDSSWDRGKEPFQFPLGGGQVIAGWDQGVEGMKVGGRRELVIPPDLGYGAQGAGEDILPNETLVFVVDLERIG